MVSHCRRISDEATSLRTVQIPPISAALLSVDQGYRAARPCILALIARMEHVNATVVALPEAIAVSRVLCTQKSSSETLKTREQPSARWLAGADCPDGTCQRHRL